MTPVEDRTRAAMDAITGLVESVAPLTLPPPPGLSFAGVTGAADDRTFVADAHRVGDTALAFFGGVQTGPRTYASAIRVLDLSRPDGGILASSRAAVQVPMTGYTARPPFGCDLIFREDIVITGNGKSFVCGGSGASSATLPTLWQLVSVLGRQPALSGRLVARGSAVGTRGCREVEWRGSGLGWPNTDVFQHE